MPKGASPSPTIELFVASDGNDRWSGRLEAPSSDGSDGPFATPSRARDAVRELKRRGMLTGSVTVWLREGRYTLREPLELAPEDSAPVTYAAYPGETPVLDGGTRITGWRVETVNGRSAWATSVPGVAEGSWVFRSLFVNGRRRPRARLPKVAIGSRRTDFHVMEDVPGTRPNAALFDGSSSFVARAGDVREWRNLTDVEVVALHYWVEERMPIASFDPATRLVTSTRRSIFALRDDTAGGWARYYVENVFEALTEPGEWYLDRPAGTLYYLPLPGETPEGADVVAPRLVELLRLEGKPDQGAYVEFVRFVGIVFEHADWRPPSGGHDPDTGSAPGIDYASSPQAAASLGGAVSFKGACSCALEDCVIRHVGLYALDMGDGSRGNRVVGNEITDAGGGGIKLSGSDSAGPLSRRSGRNVITDNHIYSCGRVFHSAVGIISRHSSGNLIAHNHIHDLFYSGISCGWVWGYGDTVSRDNRIEKNHIHDLGHGWLSDMGGIYTLGVQPGTVLRGNLIHDVVRANYGGWAIYPDEGSSHIVIEDNVCFDTNSQPFHQHYGEENVVRNNIFAFGGEAQIALSRVDSRIGFSFERNIVLSSGQPIFTGGYAFDPKKPGMQSDLNLFWDVSGPPVKLTKDLGLEEWRAAGRDLHSLVSDPLFVDAAKRDFRLAPQSPAFALGFRPIDLGDVGPREKSRRQ